jgi:hypothetical protein
MQVSEQVQRLNDLGVPPLAGLSPAAFQERASQLPEVENAIVVIHPRLVAAKDLAPLLSRSGKPGFVVEDMTDLHEFADDADLGVPDTDLYLVHDVERGDELRNWSPDEAYPSITRRGRSPLTVNEGICWLLAHPEMLEPNHCFMTIGTRKTKPNGTLDARTPAVWISGGTGRDGKERRGAPKVGWCWAGNRHTWLGFASTAGRRA